MCACTVDGCFHSLEIHTNICASSLSVYAPLRYQCEGAHTDTPTYKCHATVCLKRQEGSMTCYTVYFFDQTCQIGLNRASNYINTKDNSTSGIWFFAALLMLGDCPDYIMLGDCLDHHCARGLPRPPSCSGTVQTTIVLGDCPDHSPNIARKTALLSYM